MQAWELCSLYVVGTNFITLCRLKDILAPAEVWWCWERQLCPCHSLLVARRNFCLFKLLDGGAQRRNSLPEDCPQSAATRSRYAGRVQLWTASCLVVTPLANVCYNEAWLSFTALCFCDTAILGVGYIPDRLCGPVVRVPGYRSTGSGFDSRRQHIFVRSGGISQAH
jgi:hypothetical protein